MGKGIEMEGAGPVSKAAMEARRGSDRSTAGVNAPESLSTRVTQLERLRNLDDTTGWVVFVGKYRGLIRRLALRAGLREDDVQDVVQETLAAVAHKMPEFVYDPEKCSFQGWIRHVTACRISDRLRRRSKDPSQMTAEEGPEGAELVEALMDEQESASRDREWLEEWRAHLLEQAMATLEKQVNPEHFQIFRMTFVQQTPAAKVARTLGVMVPKVYLVKHRLARLLKAEIERLCSEATTSP